MISLLSPKSLVERLIPLPHGLVEFAYHQSVAIPEFCIKHECLVYSLSPNFQQLVILDLRKGASKGVGVFLLLSQIFLIQTPLKSRRDAYFLSL